MGGKDAPRAVVPDKIMQRICVICEGNCAFGSFVHVGHAMCTTLFEGRDVLAEEICLHRQCILSLMTDTRPKVAALRSQESQPKQKPEPRRY